MVHEEWSLHQSTMMDNIVWVVVLLVLSHGLVGPAGGNPVLYHEAGGEQQRPLAATLSQRLASHAPALEARSQDPRLPLPGLPSPQELDAIKKVAQILIMLGEQVIPSIIGELPPPPTPAPASGHSNNCDLAPAPASPLEDIPNDPVKDN